MLPPHRCPRRLHPALAVVLAGALHAALFASLALAPEPPASPRPDAIADIEISLDELVALAEDGMAPSSPPARTSSAGRNGEAGDAEDTLLAPPSAAPSPAQPPPTAPSQPPPAAPRPPRSLPAASAAQEQLAASRLPEVRPTPLTPPDALGTAPELSGSTDLAEPGAAPANAPGAPAASGAGAAMEKHIDLGLNGGVRRAATLEGWLEPPPPPPPPSVGRLVEGLAELDAQRGLSRSSAANHAGYQAARQHAPASGIGVFDIVTDERGVVLSVTLASAGSEEARWQQVGEKMFELLKERRLRVPPGAKGLAARLRIERGDLAQDLAERGRTKRGVTIGQAPLHARETRYESTRASLEPGQLSPSLGMQVAGGRSGPLTRIVLVSERAL